MKNFKIDWIFVIRLIAGIFFLYIGWQYKEWSASIMGVLWIVFASIAAFTKTGCGYTGCNTTLPTKKNEKTTIQFTEIK